MCKLTCDTKTAIHQLIQLYLNMADEYIDQADKLKGVNSLVYKRHENMATIARQCAADMQVIVDNTQ